MSKSVLFVINGYGMGNATRCAGLMDLMHDEFKIDVVTSNRALHFFEGRTTVRKLFAQTDLRFRKNHEYGSLLFFASHVFILLFRTVKNYFFQREIVNAGSYDFIVFDSDYSFILHRVFGNKKLVGVNNAFEVVQFFEKNPVLKNGVRFSLAVEKLDQMVNSAFLHWVVCPVVNPQILTCAHSKLLIAPLLVRAEVACAEKLFPEDALVMVSSSGAASDLTELAVPFEKSNVKTLLKAKSIFCNAGQSSIAECLYLSKPAVLFPIAKHAEQRANAHLAGQLGLAVYKSGGVSSASPIAAAHYNYDLLKTCISNHLKTIRESL